MNTSQIESVPTLQASVPDRQSQLVNPQSLLPVPELPIKVRLGTMDDIPFIDELQKKNNKSLGFMYRKTLEGKIEREEVLIAEEVGGRRSAVGGEDADSMPPTADCRLPTTRLGYLIGNDRYFKRDELGAIFQLCVVSGKRRGLIGATLLKSLFERASYGTKLYCCWCAQDLDANYFWEAMGFVPVAFRTGSRNKNKRADGKKSARIHIYWQKRIRSGDTTTPYWYPHQTGGGSIDEDRLVLPIPLNMHWSEVEHTELPGESPVASEQSPDVPMLESLATGDCQPATKSKPKRVKPVVESPPVSRSVARLVMPQFGSKMKAAKEKVVCEKPVKPVKVKQKNDPVKVKAARELRDRWTELLNSPEYQAALVPVNAKYEVGRLIQSGPAPSRLLEVTPVDVKRVA